MFQMNRQKRLWTVCTGGLCIWVAAIFFAGIWSGPAQAETLTFRLAWIKTSTNAVFDDPLHHAQHLRGPFSFGSSVGHDRTAWENLEVSGSAFASSKDIRDAGPT